MYDNDRLQAALREARRQLLAERDRSGHWVGELSTSALSTATAVSALILVERHDAVDSRLGCFANESRELGISELIMRGLHWLADHQNADGGWGDTDRSYSNIATTMLVQSAFHLAGVPAKHSGMLERAQQYVKQQGGVAALRKRYGRDKTFAVPILTNCALAGLVPWSKVSPLPFEAACVPQKYYRYLGLPVVSYAIPALVAIGQVRYFFQRPWNPLVRMIRGWAVEPSLRVLEKMQPISGGYLEATPLTSFVVMSLAACKRVDHPVVQHGVRFIVDSVLPDGSWPIDTDLATWNTTLAMNALASVGDDIGELECHQWLLSCQHREEHPFTGADPGGWGWTDLSGAVPDADDTPGALLTLRQVLESPAISAKERKAIESAANMGVEWLLKLQNRDGGWPTFCRGWSKQIFDRSGADLTAHAIRALFAWQGQLEAHQNQIAVAIQRGLQFLARNQHRNGSWLPLWFGNQDQPGEANPIYGTAKVLLAYRDLGMSDSIPAHQGLRYLAGQQNADGGWGGGAATQRWQPEGIVSSVEETSLAVEALCSSDLPQVTETVRKGLDWICRAVEENRLTETSPIGFYFAKLWYYERLYPLSFSVSALGHASQYVARQQRRGRAKLDPPNVPCVAGAERMADERADYRGK